MASNDPVRTLIGIFTLVWILVLVGTIIIFRYIVPLDLFHSYLDNVLKGVLSAILGLIWIALFVELRNIMIKRQFIFVKKQAGAERR